MLFKKGEKEYMGSYKRIQRAMTQSKEDCIGDEQVKKKLVKNLVQ